MAACSLHIEAPPDCHPHVVVDIAPLQVVPRVVEWLQVDTSDTKILGLISTKKVAFFLWFSFGCPSSLNFRIGVLTAWVQHDLNMDGA